MTVSKKPSDSSQLLTLVQRCAGLCTSAERSLKKLSPEKQTFLANNLEVAMQQVELLLRVIGETHEGNRDAERQGLLRRLFTRTDGSPDQPIELPKFDVSTQGLQGNSWTVSIAELLSFLTGMLWVDTPSENFLIGISNARLLHASSDQTPEGLRLGEVLVGLGFLTRRQLERYLTSGTDVKSVSGEALLEAGIISDEELRQALCHQVSKLFGRLIKAKDAIFRFQEGLHVQVAFQVDLDINQLLLDSARVRDEDVSPAQIAASVMKEWNSWRTELDTKIGEVASEIAPAPASGAAPAAAPAAAVPKPPSTPEPAAAPEARRGKSTAKS
jgi:hypothetical protein